MFDLLGRPGLSQQSGGRSNITEGLGPEGPRACRRMRQSPRKAKEIFLFENISGPGADRRSGRSRTEKIGTCDFTHGLTSRFPVENLMVPGQGVGPDMTGKITSVAVI